MTVSVTFMLTRHGNTAILHPMRNARQMAGWLIGVVVSVALPCLSLAASPLDGTVWRVEISAATMKARTVDEFRFAGGTFLSSFFLPQGFPASRYTLTEEKNRPLIWETLQTGKDQASISWHGEVEGNTLRGVALLRQPGAPNITYTFAGQKIRLAAPAAPGTPQPKAQAPEAKPKPKPKQTPLPTAPAPAAPAPVAPPPTAP